MNIYLQYEAILAKFGIHQWAILAEKWAEPHRFYHQITHLEQLLTDIELLCQQELMSQEEYEILVMVAFFHDSVYDPKRQDNEQQSIAFFKQLASNTNQAHEQICTLIADTQTHQASSNLSQIFIDLDMKIVTHGSFYELLAWEKAIFKEYQYVDYAFYKAGRLHLIQQFAQKYLQNAINLNCLANFLLHHKPRIGVYAGSFNPFHNGHFNILQKAEKIFDKVIVARGINPDKMAHETPEMNLKALAFRQKEDFVGLLTDYLKSKETAADITLIRGLRNGDDLNYEVNQLRFMEEMKPDLKIIFIACDSQYEHISSSAIKNLEKINQGLGKKYLPE